MDKDELRKEIMRTVARYQIEHIGGGSRVIHECLDALGVAAGALLGGTEMRDDCVNALSTAITRGALQGSKVEGHG